MTTPATVLNLPKLNSLFSLLEQNYKKRESYIKKNSLRAYRLYSQEKAFLPVNIDIYDHDAVVHVFRGIEKTIYAELEEALKRLLAIENFYYKDRTKERLALPSSGPRKEMVIEEYGHKFLINLSDYLDTGLFLDHRETRKWIAEKSKNKVILNTFAYTGSFSIYAAAAGAKKTYSVDLSKTYCEWIKKNLELNGLPPEQNWVYKMDTLEFFRYAKRKQLSFDIIIIDPPTFSKNKGLHFSVQKDHPKLLNEALQILSPQGFILFSNNYKEFKLNKSALDPCQIFEKTDKIPPDFTGSSPHRCFIINKR
jgi:23S rRNA (cytosine1962-C5)-methyltransferase